MNLCFEESDDEAQKSESTLEERYVRLGITDDNTSLVDSTNRSIFTEKPGEEEAEEENDADSPLNKSSSIGSGERADMEYERKLTLYY